MVDIAQGVSLTYEQAVVALKNVNTFEELAVLINKLDAQGTGTNTLLYSGNFAKDFGTNQLALGMANQDSSIRIVDNTLRAKFLDLNKNKALVDKLKELGGDPTKYEIIDAKGNIARAATISNRFLYDINFTDPATGRIMFGAWSQLSHDFVMLADGNVRVLSPFADPSRVLAEVEIKALMDNPKVTHIEGYPKSFFERLGADAEAVGKNAHSVRLAALIN